MAKIPLENTIGGAYRFVFSNIPSILGIVWFPYLVFGGLAGTLIWFAIAHFPLTGLSLDPKHPNLAPLFAFARLLPAVVVLLVIGELIATIGLTRKALGLMHGPNLFFFSLGVPVWRLLGALVIVYLIVVGVACAFAAVAVVWALYGQNAIVSAGLRALIDAIGIFAMVLLLIYMVLRLVFFIPAVVVAEETIGIARSWALGRGNVWRIFVVLLMVSLPPGIAFGILNSAVTTLLYGPMPAPPFAGNPHPDPQQVIDFCRTVFSRIGPAVLALQVVYGITVRALYAGAVANAYRSVAVPGSIPRA